MIFAAVSSGSVAASFTWTALVYQPLLPAVPASVAVVVGGVPSAVSADSKAPISQAVPWGRLTPRWSMATPALLQPPAAGIASMAGDPAARAMVGVGPSLLVSGPSCGFALVRSCGWLKPHEVPMP